MANAKGLIATGPPDAPGWLFILRIAVIILSVGCFVAGAYNVSLKNRIITGDVSEGAAGGMAIFTGIWTWIVLGLDIAFAMTLRTWYFRIGFFIGYILSILFWLVTWAVAAAAASEALSCSDKVCDKYGGSAAAVAALGAVLWIILIVVFVFWTMAAVNGPVEATAAANPANSTELGAVKAEAGAYPVAGGAPPQQYPPQQYPSQGYPEQQGTPAPYQQPPYAAPASPAPQQPYGQSPYPEQPVGYPQEPHQQYPPQGQPGAPYPQ